MSRRKDRLARIRWANEQMALRTQMRDKIASLTQERDAAMATGAYLKSELDRRKIPTIEGDGKSVIVDIMPPPKDRLMQISSMVYPYEGFAKSFREAARDSMVRLNERISTIEFQEMRTALRNGMQIRWWMPVSRD